MFVVFVCRQASIIMYNDNFRCIHWQLFFTMMHQNATNEMFIYSVCLWYIFIFKVSGAEKDPFLLMLKGRAHLNKGQVDQALQVKTVFTYWIYSYLIKLVQSKLVSLL